MKSMSHCNYSVLTLNFCSLHVFADTCKSKLIMLCLVIQIEGACFIMYYIFGFIISFSFVGVFYSNKDDVIKSMDEIHKVGTFVRILEVQQLEQRNALRLLVMGHRR